LRGIEYTAQPLALKHGAKFRIANRHPLPGRGVGVAVPTGGTGVLVGVLVGVRHGLLYLSIKVWTGPLPDRVSPTAHTSPVGLTTSTSLSGLKLVPELGLGTIAQLVPSQCIVSVWLANPLLLLAACPTAHTSFVPN